MDQLKDGSRLQEREDIAVYLTGGCFPQKRLELIGDLCDRLGTDRPIS